MKAAGGRLCVFVRRGGLKECSPGIYSWAETGGTGERGRRFTNFFVSHPAQSEQKGAFSVLLIRRYRYIPASSTAAPIITHCSII